MLSSSGLALSSSESPLTSQLKKLALSNWIALVIGMFVSSGHNSTLRAQNCMQWLAAFYLDARWHSTTELP